MALPFLLGPCCIGLSAEASGAAVTGGQVCRPGREQVLQPCPASGPRKQSSRSNCTAFCLTFTISNRPPRRWRANSLSSCAAMRA